MTRSRPCWFPFPSARRAWRGCARNCAPASARRRCGRFSIRVEHRTRRRVDRDPGFLHPEAGPIPWFREASSRVIRAGELVGLDTDLVGPFGYCADISRTWFCGPGRPTDEQRRLYGPCPRAGPVQHRHSRTGHEFRRGCRKILARSGGVPGPAVRHRRPRSRSCRRVSLHLLCRHATTLLDRGSSSPA